MIHPKTKLVLRNEEDFFGPGLAELLVRTREYGSLHMASESMHMSYSKAQKLVKCAEREAGFTMLNRKAGGKNGGFSELTCEGEEFLQNYFALQKDVQEAADRLFEKHFPELCQTDDNESACPTDTEHLVYD